MTRPLLPTAAEDPRRLALLARWTLLTGTVLPALARRHRDLLRRHHSIKRGWHAPPPRTPWGTGVVRRPAQRHLDLSQLAAAVAQAERVAAEPTLLPTLNRTSLRLRGKAC